MATDPVCGMYVDERTATLRLQRDNRTYYFCAESCLEQFAAPEAARQRIARRLAVAWPLAAVVLFLTYGVPSTLAFWGAALLAGVVQFYSGSAFYRGAWDALRSRNANMDLLIAVGTTTAFVYSVVALARPGAFPPSYYFDASSLIVTLILTGNYLEHLVRDRAGVALHRLNELLPTTALRLENGVVRSVPVGELEPGHRVRVLPGARIPADGVVLSGHTTVEESILTGESLPVAKGVRDTVLAGSMNGEGALEVEVTGRAEDSFVAQVGRLLTDAEMARVPLRSTADRIAAAFVPTVLVLSIAAAVVWYAFGGASPTVSILIFVSVVITACPCAFGIATPAAIVVGVGRAARDGVLFRGGDALERAARADLVLMDKTGTLTRPVPGRVDVVPAAGHTSESILGLAAGLEAGSEHPLARAVEAASWAAGVPAKRIDELRADPGRGVRGHLDGVDLALLSGVSARTEGVDLAGFEVPLARVDSTGESWSVVVLGGKAIGMLTFPAELAPGAVEGVAGLQRLGIPVVMVTGDRPEPARAVARRVGITEVVAGVLPSAKVDLVRKYTAQGRHVAFVGDGLNDAAALAAADVGIALGTGSDVAQEAGQVLLVRPDLRGVARAIGIARRTVARVGWNLGWALGYNLVLLPIAAGALVPLWGFRVYQVLPVAGAVAMGLSSTTVVLASLSLRRAPDPTRTRASRPAAVPG